MTLEDFINLHEELVHQYAGDDKLGEFNLVLQSIILLAKQEERKRMKPWIWHSRQCDLQRFGSGECTCGLREAMEPKP